MKVHVVMSFKQKEIMWGRPFLPGNIAPGQYFHNVNFKVAKFTTQSQLKGWFQSFVLQHIIYNSTTEKLIVAKLTSSFLYGKSLTVK